MKKTLQTIRQSLALAAALGVVQANAQITGPSSSKAPYLEAMDTNVTFTSVMTVGDSVNLKPDGITPYRFVGIPDGLGAFDNGDGTFTVLCNHELGASAGVARAHGGIGAFVSRFVINKANLQVLNVSDLMTRVYVFVPALYDLVQTNNFRFSRFCSADLPPVSAFYDSNTGKGTTNLIFMNGEEDGSASAGRGVAHVVTGQDVGVSFDLPWLGKMAWENSLASPFEQEKTVVACMDDDGTADSQLYIYVGTKITTGSNDVENAGLHNGSLYGVSVAGLALETAGTTPIQRTFVLTNLSAKGDVSQLTANQLEQLGNTNAVTAFMRVEDGAWDPTHPNDLYFLTTASPTLPSRLWRLRFNSITNPLAGGVVDMVLDGTEGQFMMDNMGADADGNMLITEDPGNQARLARIWKYYPDTDGFAPLGQARRDQFLSGQPNFITQDEEISGIIDIRDILGPGSYLLDAQVHNAANVSNSLELVEGGQLLVMNTGASTPAITDQPDSVGVSVGGNATFSVAVSEGAWVQWYFNGAPIAGATNSSYTVNNVSGPNTGTYYAIIANAGGSQVSGLATLYTTGIALYSGLTITGPVGSRYRIEWTGSLTPPISWNTLNPEFVLTSSPLIYVDPTPASGNGVRYYRAVPLP